MTMTPKQKKRQARIINDLTYNSLKDFSSEAKSLFETYMFKYLK